MKQLIHFDETAFCSKVAEITGIIETCAEKFETYETLGSGKITKAAWEAVTRGDKDAFCFEVAKGLKSKFEKSGISGAKFIRKEVKDAVDEAETLFNIWRVALTGFGTPQLVQYLSFEAGKIVFTSDAESKLKATFETYAPDGEGTELFELQQKVGKDLQELAKRIGIDPWRLPLVLFSHVFEIKGNDIVPLVLVYENAQKVA